MSKKSFLKALGIAPLFIFLLASQVWKITFEVKMAIPIFIILLGLTSIVLTKQNTNQSSTYKYLTCGVALVLILLVFSYQYFAA